MKRIFLTSGIILCMASSAFATAHDIDTAGKLVGTDTTPAPDASCVENTLGSYTGPTTFYAKWSKAYIDVVLNPNTSNQNGAAENSVFTTGTNESDTLYATSTTMYKTLANTGELTDPLTADTSTVLASPIPVGHDVALTFNANYGYINNTLNAATNGTGYSPTSYAAESFSGIPANSSATRTFKGFWADPITESGSALIDSNGVITTTGANAAMGAVTSGQDIEWYAHYNCAEPAHAGTPSLRGYHFDGWYAEAAANNAIENWCLVDASNEVFAKWTAHTGTLTYACGSLPTNTNGTGTLSGNGSSESVTFDKGVTLKDAATAGCTAQGYHFVGWNCNYNLATGDAYSGDAANYAYTSTGPAHTSGSFDNGNNIIARYGVVAANGLDNANVTCTAKWQANTIGLTWLVGDGATANTEDTGGTSCTYDESIDLPGTPTKPGYTFNGWSVTNPNE